MLQITRKPCTYIQVKLTTPKIQGSVRILFYIFILALFISFLTGNMAALADSKLAVIPLLHCKTTSVTGSPGNCGCHPVRLFSSTSCVLPPKVDPGSAGQDNYFWQSSIKHCFVLWKILRKKGFSSILPLQEVPWT